MGKLTEQERFVRRFFTKKGIDIDEHPNITGLILEGDNDRVIGFLSCGALGPEYLDKPLMHPANAGVAYVVEGEVPLYPEPDRGLGRVTCLSPSDVLDFQEIKYLDPYHLLDMLERAEDVGLTEFDPACEIYFVHRQREEEK